MHACHYLSRTVRTAHSLLSGSLIRHYTLYARESRGHGGQGHASCEQGTRRRGRLEAGGSSTESPDWPTIVANYL